MEGPCGSDSALPQMRKATILVLALAMLPAGPAIAQTDPPITVTENAPEIRDDTNQAADPLPSQRRLAGLCAGRRAPEQHIYLRRGDLA